MNNPAIFSLKVRNPTKFIARQCIVLHSGLALNHAFSLGHGFSSIKVLPTPEKRARQRNKGMAENHTNDSTKSSLSMGGRCWEDIIQQILRNKQPCNLSPKEKNMTVLLFGERTCPHFWAWEEHYIDTLSRNKLSMWKWCRQSFWSCLTQTALLAALVPASRVKKDGSRAVVSSSYQIIQSG